MTATTSDVIVLARARAFSGRPIRLHRFAVSPGEVRVWDSIAGHYTACHALSPSAIARIRRLARQEAKP